MIKYIYVLPFVLCFSACAKRNRINETEVRDSTVLHFTVLSVLPHDKEAFTEGLIVYNNKVLESTGQYGKSWIAEADPVSGVHQKKVILPENYFGEGITVMNGKIYHLTYTSGVGFVYEAETYRKIRDFEYDKKIKEGWGLTNNGIHLILSDGTDKLHFMDTMELKVIKSIRVKDGAGVVTKINELEYVDGYIFANVWETNWILKIDPQSGKVVGKLDFSTVGQKVKTMYPQSLEMNGVAYDQNSKVFLVTGKFWPESYLIKIK